MTQFITEQFSLFLKKRKKKEKAFPVEVLETRPKGDHTTGHCYANGDHISLKVILFLPFIFRLFISPSQEGVGGRCFFPFLLCLGFQIFLSDFL